jgi:hypothetical protein
MRKRVLWIGLGLVLLLGVVMAVVVPRYLAGCRPVPGAATFTGTSSDPAGADGIGDVNYIRAPVTVVTTSPDMTSSFVMSLPLIGCTGRPRSPLGLPRIWLCSS